MNQPTLTDPRPGDTFPNLPAFYAANPLRKRSGEMDFGVWWRDERAGPPFYRVSILMDTAEVYAIRMVGTSPYGGGQDEVEYLGTIIVNSEPDPADRYPAVYRQARSVVLANWVDHIHTKNSLQWVRDRLAAQR